MSARPSARPAALPPAGKSIGAHPGDVVTVAAELIGFELVNRCAVAFIPAGEQVPVKGRLIELVQPLSDGAPREPGLEEPTTLYVVPDGAKAAVAYPVPTHTPVAVAVDPA